MAEDQTAPADRRSGRGRLSSIDMLPEICDEDIAWANTELRERKMPQTEILAQFNARLADKGIRGVSKGAFSRYSVRNSTQRRAIQTANEIARTLSLPSFGNSQSTGPVAVIEAQRLVLINLLSAPQLDRKTIRTAASLLVQLIKEAE